LRPAFVITDYDATVDQGSGTEHVSGDVAYFEDAKKCRSQENAGNFFCYQTRIAEESDPHASVVIDGHTRAFLCCCPLKA
jgi:hypothetical protein